MGFSLKTPERHEEWFSIPGCEGSSVLVVELPAGDRDLFLESVVTKAAAGADIKTDLRRVYVDAIKDWKEIDGPDGVAAACDEENKLRFLSCPGILSFVRDSLGKVNKEAERRRKDAEKN